MAIYHLDLPQTVAWEKLINERKESKTLGIARLGSDLIDVEKMRLIYKVCEGKKEARLYGIYEEGMDFEGDGIVVPLSSSLNDLYDLPQGTRFVNVIGSSYDKAGSGTHTGSWIAIYDFVTNSNSTHCCTDGFVYYNVNSRSNKVCDNSVVGGHVILGENTQPKVPNLWETVGLLPICSKHNSPIICDGYMLTGCEIPFVKINYTLREYVYKDVLMK